MTARSMYDDLLFVDALTLQTITTSAVNTGDEDMFGYNGAEFSVTIGSIDGATSGSPTGGTITVLVEHADDDGTGSAGTYANAAAVDIVGLTPSSGIVHTFDEDNTTSVQFSYVGDKRFVRVTLTPAGLGSGGPVGVQMWKHTARHRSVQATQAP
jgi:hypothetical protein